MTNEEYLRLQLKWVNYRLEALGRIEAKLGEMRDLAEYARNHKLSPVTGHGVNIRLQVLKQEVMELDNKSKLFWLT